MLCLDWNGWHSVKKKLLPNNPSDGSIYNSIVANGWEKYRLFVGDFLWLFGEVLPFFTDINSVFLLSKCFHFRTHIFSNNTVSCWLSGGQMAHVYTIECDFHSLTCQMEIFLRIVSSGLQYSACFLILLFYFHSIALSFHFVVCVLSLFVPDKWVCQTPQKMFYIIENIGYE